MRLEIDTSMTLTVTYVVKMMILSKKIKIKNFKKILVTHYLLKIEHTE